MAKSFTEELSDEAIQAIQRRDSQSFEALLATQEELVAAGIALQKMPILLSQLREAKKGSRHFPKPKGRSPKPPVGCNLRQIAQT